MMRLEITANDVEDMKAELRATLPEVKSSHRIEALARGLGWNTNAAMRARLANGSAEVSTNEGAFLGYLQEHGFDSEPGRLARTLAKVGIRHAMALEPLLTQFGYNVYRGRSKTPEERRAEFMADRASMLGDHAADEFIQACRFLSQFSKRKTINRKSSSYGLKHQAERFGDSRHSRGYVANGMLIAAALTLGFKVQQIDPDSPNAWFNISSKMTSDGAKLALAA
ncbi:hypothetical protein [Xanthobacter autotrophicus]|uniref:hypothetical protein n=2 Tax=Xanthobacter autotrophicus TaxID=280 RepID=UPI00372B2B52